jgi:hypothetical protein
MAFTGNTVLQKELYNSIPTVTVWRVLGKRLYLKMYKLAILQSVEMYNLMPLSVNVFVTLATQAAYERREIIIRCHHLTKRTANAPV